MGFVVFVVVSRYIVVAILSLLYGCVCGCVLFVFSVCFCRSTGLSSSTGLYIERVTLSVCFLYILYRMVVVGYDACVRTARAQDTGSSMIMPVSIIILLPEEIVAWHISPPCSTPQGDAGIQE